MDIYYFPLLIVLIFIIYQDLKFRAIHFTLPIFLFIIGYLLNFNELLLWKTAVNIGFVFLVFLGVFLYFSIKYKKWSNPINREIGFGDILFFLAISPLFTLHAYMLFFITGILFSLLAHMVLNYKTYRTTTIPLAGYLSVHLIICTFLNYLTNIPIFKL